MSKEHCPKCGTQTQVIATAPSPYNDGSTREFFSCNWCNHEWHHDRHTPDTEAKVAPV